MNPTVSRSVSHRSVSETKSGNASGRRFATLMRIKIIKEPPAPLMDGFDVANLRRGEVYDVGPRLGSYLMLAGYAARERDLIKVKPDRATSSCRDQDKH